MRTRAGVVLAGGYATRFGDGDKTLAELDGKPLVAHAIDALEPVVDDVLLSCRDEQIPSFEAVVPDVHFRPDPAPDEGPLAGLATALDGLDAEQVAVTTADKPCVPTDLYRHFFEQLDGDGIVIRSDGILQPAPAVFESAALRSVVRKHRREGRARLRPVLAALDLTIVTDASVRERWGDRVFADVNTIADLDALRS